MSTLADLIANHPSDKNAILIPGGPTTTYGEFGEQIEQTAEILAAAGVEKGRTVSIVLGNSLDFMITFLAVTRSGAIAAPLEEQKVEGGHNEVDLLADHGVVRPARPASARTGSMA